MRGRRLEASFRTLSREKHSTHLRQTLGGEAKARGSINKVKNRVTHPQRNSSQPVGDLSFKVLQTDLTVHRL